MREERKKTESCFIIMHKHMYKKKEEDKKIVNIYHNYSVSTVQEMTVTDTLDMFEILHLGPLKHNKQRKAENEYNGTK